MTEGEPIRYGVAGLGGYAAQVCDHLMAEAQAAAPAGRLVVVSDPRMDRAGELVTQLCGKGVKVVAGFADLLAEDLDIVWLPLPIDLHREYTLRALDAGKAVMCEKPAAGSVDDVDAMITARDRTRLPVAIGYQDLYEPGIAELKRRLVRGEFGVVLSGSVLACWPRSEQYYQRNPWAGRLARDGKWILDSPACNAMAHYIHLAQYLLGPAEGESATPAEIEAELYRVNEIENYDTCSLRLTFEGGAHLLVALTHACRTQVDAEIVIRTQYARIRVLPRQSIEIQTSSVTESRRLAQDHFVPMLQSVSHWLRQPASPPPCSLEMARAHVVTVNAASQAAPIARIPAQHVEVVADAHGFALHTVHAIEAAMRTSIAAGRMLHESGLVRWSQPASELDVRGYSHFTGPFQAGQTKSL